LLLLLLLLLLLSKFIRIKQATNKSFSPLPTTTKQTKQCNKIFQEKTNKTRRRGIENENESILESMPMLATKQKKQKQKNKQKKAQKSDLQSIYHQPAA
jgi:hypothetical protein